MQDKWMPNKKLLIKLDFLHLLCVLMFANLPIYLSITVTGFSFKHLHFLFMDSVYYTQMALISASICPQVVHNLANPFLTFITSYCYCCFSLISTNFADFPNLSVQYQEHINIILFSNIYYIRFFKQTNNANQLPRY